MNHQQTIQKLKQLRLHGMAGLHEQQLKNNTYENMTRDEYLALLTDHEYEDKQNRKIKRLIKQAHFRQNASIADIAYQPTRNIDKYVIQRLTTLEFMDRHENIIVTGPSGVGKSYIAQALGYQACLMIRKALYVNTARLFTRIKLAKLDGTYLKELKKLANTELLILDDFGLQKLDQVSKEILMDIVDDRYSSQSTIICSQIPVSAWYDLIGEGTIADAILDRIVHNAHRLDLKGESMRKGILKPETD